MRDGLKYRINGNQNYLNTNTLSQILEEEGIKKNHFNLRVKPDINYCPSNGCTNSPIDLEKRNHYNAPFRQPVKGYRKTINCDPKNKNCLFTTEIYKDSYSNSCFRLCRPEEYTSLPTSNKPGASSSRATSGISARAGRPLIRSGMQPNRTGQQNSGLGNAKSYSYSYRELLNNRRKATFEKKLPTKQPETGFRTTGYGGDCSDKDDKCYSKTIYRLNNDQYKVQGAVDSSDRITRLKLNTVKAGRPCNTSSDKTCRGIYRPGNAQTVATTVEWPKPKNDYDKVKYKAKFNSKHSEVNYPQVSALARVRGNVSKSKTNFSKNSTICCDDPKKSNNGY